MPCPSDIHGTNGRSTKRRAEGSRYVGYLRPHYSPRYSEGMTLSSMVVSRDRQEVSIFERILAGLHMDVEVERDPQQALTRITKSKIDALIVDCDLNGIPQFLHQLQRLEKQPNTVPLVIMGARHGHHRMDESGALFVFEKPISVEQAVRTLSAARTTILEGRLRYHRAGLEVPVAVNGKGRKRTDGYLVNVSQGGMQIRTDDSQRNLQLWLAQQYFAN